MLESLIAWSLTIAEKFGYEGIILLMAMENSLVPLPSEVIIPPFAWLANMGQYNLFLVILAGVVGTLIGALINYFLALWLGRPLVYKLAEKKGFHWLGITPKKIKKSEEFFQKNGAWGTFIGRLIPVVRQFVPLPAGFAKMHLGKFIIFTSLGSGIWVSILALLGYVLGANQGAFSRYYSQIQWLALLVFVFWLLYYLYRQRRQYLNKLKKTDK